MRPSATSSWKAPARDAVASRVSAHRDQAAVQPAGHDLGRSDPGARAGRHGPLGHREHDRRRAHRRRAGVRVAGGRPTPCAGVRSARTGIPLRASSPSASVWRRRHRPRRSVRRARRGATISPAGRSSPLWPAHRAAGRATPRASRSTAREGGARLPHVGVVASILVVDVGIAAFVLARPTRCSSPSRISRTPISSPSPRRRGSASPSS